MVSKGYIVDERNDKGDPGTLCFDYGKRCRVEKFIPYWR